ncbi:MULTISPECIES: thermonuclease family protein [Rubrivivax]|uniref:Thermonuclease family protein n=1 Tax=Rubrivivax benzoatilyticus TaxID=316997 RepID=A0ABX0HZH8_9BURK|nr:MULTISPECIES: thermonuclease family protein [Rubrivivax]EGJ11673.1 putative nuclease [Rubrivivax benzoatilyticus JA2 = ATCC BAA-35]NHK99736.1 thermonuclease family protein [Rubrivivax benzoatilyticus]NHL25609.1 thermonuclease family protein [Rubrivivax benzoatilyticus]
MKTLPGLALALLAGAAFAAPPKTPIEGRVTQVIDGNTVVVTPADGAPVRVRLAGADAPLACQDWGPESRRELAERAQGHLVTVTRPVSGRDGVVTGSVLLDGQDLARHMVSEGHAWSSRVKWDRGPFVKEERVAHALQRGLHAARGALRPADFRRQHGPC